MWIAGLCKSGTCSGDSNFLLCLVGYCDQQYVRIVKLEYEDCLGYHDIDQFGFTEGQVEWISAQRK